MSRGREVELLARLEGTIATLDRLQVEAHRELAQSQQERAEQARSGALGRDWREVQDRIDRGDSSLRDVFAGRDDSAAARRLLEQSRERIASYAEQAPLELQEEVGRLDAEGRHLG